MKKQNSVSLMWTLTIVSCLCLVFVSTKDITLTCQIATTSECASGFKFRMTGTGLSSHYCLPAGQTCPINTSNVLSLEDCDVDYKNDNCTTRLCYRAASRSVCTQDFPTCNGTVDSYSYTCAGCVNVSLCGRCHLGFIN